MLEEKIKRNGWMTAVAVGIFGMYSCAPNLQVVSRVPISGGGFYSTGNNCCAQLDCRGYDGCRSEGEEWNNGALYEGCHCYSIPSPSTASSSSSSDHDHGGYIDRDRSSGGHKVCKDRSGGKK